MCSRTDNVFGAEPEDYTAEVPTEEGHVIWGLLTHRHGACQRSHTCFLDAYTRMTIEMADRRLRSSRSKDV